MMVVIDRMDRLVVSGVLASLASVLGGTVVFHTRTYPIHFVFVALGSDTLEQFALR